RAPRCASGVRRPSRDGLRRGRLLRKDPSRRRTAPDTPAGAPDRPSPPRCPLPRNTKKRDTALRSSKGGPMAQTAQQLRRIDVAENEAQRVFTLQRQAYLRTPYPSYEERRENLHKLERILVDNASAIADAISADFGHRAVEETLMAELFTSVDG